MELRRRLQRSYLGTHQAVVLNGHGFQRLLKKAVVKCEVLCIGARLSVVPINRRYHPSRLQPAAQASRFDFISGLFQPRRKHRKMNRAVESA
jgi:hypothetical protein